MTRSTATIASPRNATRLTWYLLMLASMAALLATIACSDAWEEQGASDTQQSASPTAVSGFPTVSPATPTTGSQETIPSDIEMAARILLADIATVNAGDLTLISSESVSWSDASLGCPQEGFGYAQVITPGYKLVFALGDTSYAVHTNSDGSSLILCNDGE